MSRFLVAYIFYICGMLLMIRSTRHIGVSMQMLQAFTRGPIIHTIVHVLSVVVWPLGLPLYWLTVRMHGGRWEDQMIREIVDADDMTKEAKAELLLHVHSVREKNS